MLRSTRYSETPTSRTIEPVEVDELHRQLRIDHHYEDADLSDYIVEARAELEALLGDRALITGTIVEYFDDWDDEMQLHWSPVVSITHVKYYDPDETLQTLGTSTYELGVKHGMGILRLKFDQSWPTLRGHTADDIVVTYTAGEGTSRSNVPKSLRRWIKARAAWLWSNRDGVQHEWQKDQMDALLMPYKRCEVIGAQ